MKKKQNSKKISSFGPSETTKSVEERLAKKKLDIKNFSLHLKP